MAFIEMDFASGSGSISVSVPYIQAGTTDTTPTTYATLTKGKYVAVANGLEGGGAAEPDLRTTPTVRTGTATITSLSDYVTFKLNTVNSYLRIWQIDVTSDVATILHPKIASMAIITID